MTLQVPWVISDVTEVPLEAARLVSYAATNGKQGVVGPGDLLVRELATPGSSVRIALGAFACVNNFPNNTSQTYMGWNDAEITKAITATGGSARSDLVYVRINDAGQTGGGTSGPATIEVAQDVGTSVTKLSQVLPNIAGVELARIDVPASTSTITQAYITDLRTLVQPRKDEIVRIYNAATGTDSLTSSTYVTWPASASWSVSVPSWAIRAQIIANVNYQVYKSAGGGGNVAGDLRVKLGSYTTASTRYNLSFESGTADYGTSFIADDISIAAADRGSTLTLSLQGRKSFGDANATFVDGSTVAVQVKWYEAPDESYWG